MSIQLSPVDLSERRIRSAIARILRVAENTENFLDLCDAERLD